MGNWKEVIKYTSKQSLEAPPEIEEAAQGMGEDWGKRSHITDVGVPG